MRSPPCSTAGVHVEWNAGCVPDASSLPSHRPCSTPAAPSTKQATGACWSSGKLKWPTATVLPSQRPVAAGHSQLPVLHHDPVACSVHRAAGVHNCRGAHTLPSGQTKPLCGCCQARPPVVQLAGTLPDLSFWGLLPALGCLCCWVPHCAAPASCRCRADSAPSLPSTPQPKGAVKSACGQGASVQHRLAAGDVMCVHALPRSYPCKRLGRRQGSQRHSPFERKPF